MCVNGLKFKNRTYSTDAKFTCILPAQDDRITTDIPALWGLMKQDSVWLWGGWGDKRDERDRGTRGFVLLTSRCRRHEYGALKTSFCKPKLT